MPLSKASHQAINSALKTIADIDDTPLKHYLQKKKQVLNTIVEPPVTNAVSKTTNHIAASPAWKLQKENLAALQKFIEQLKLKAYSASTIKTYRNEFLNCCSC